MKHLGLFAFGVTTCVLVPTALHLLEAGPKQVAKLVAPGERTITLDKAKVEINVDRGLVDAGDKIHVKLTATAETHQRVTVAVLVYESAGSNGGRVELPPNKVGRDEVTFDIKDGTASRQLAFTLPGNRSEGMEGMETFGHYTILVMPPKDADELEKLRRRAATVSNPMDDRGGQYGRFSSAFYSIPRTAPDGDAQPDEAPGFGKPGQIARLDVNTRSKSAAVKIIAADGAHVGDDVEVTVRVHNAAKKPIESFGITLSARPYGIANDYLGIDEDHVVIADGDRTASFAAGETKDLVFHVTATTTGVLGLYASTHCMESECYENDAARALTDVALDAVDIAPAEHPAVVVQ